MSINQDQTDVQLEQVEQEEVEQWVSLYESFTRLKANEDFQKLILDGFIKDKSEMHVSQLATEYVRKAGIRGSIMEELVGISVLQNYFNTVVNMGSFSSEYEN